MTPEPVPGRHRAKSVFVTGAASGIGRGIAERFLAEGAFVTGYDLNRGDLHHAAYAAVTGDATDAAAVDAAVAAHVARHGGLDVMVCNAGIIAVTPFAEMALAEWQRVMRVNVDSVFIAGQAAARAMIAAGRGGVIVNAASGAGRRGVPNLAHYCASKAAIINLTQTMAIELAAHGIRVNSYVPGHIETPFWGGIAAGFARITGQTPDAVIEGFRASVPAGRFGSAADVAATVSWLATPDAAYVSGQALAMNGAEFPY
jgi:meso-butanediol dehydrogenase/(S,S)-butanediol dehydrogenase/diacetyl reductase